MEEHSLHTGTVAINYAEVPSSMRRCHRPVLRWLCSTEPPTDGKA